METYQLVQIVGAVLILVGFVGAQFGFLDARSAPYLGLNQAGAIVLAAVAGAGPDWGFLLLEGAWAAVTALGIAGLVHSKRRIRAG
jgi:hypothetical protein